MPQATPSELATLQKMVEESVLYYLHNGGPEIARKKLDGASELFCNQPGWTEIYNHANEMITQFEQEQQRQAEEREAQRLKDLIVTAMGAVRSKPQPDEQPTPAEPTVLPPELSSKKAMKLWEIMQKERFIDSNYQPLVSRPQAALIAFEFFTVLDIETQWALFQGIWHRKAMSSDHSKGMNEEKHRPFYEKLLKLIKANSDVLEYVHPGAQRVQL